MKFNYKGKEYELKYSFRALMIYENITQKSFQPKTLTDIIILLYSMMISSSKEAVDFNEYLDWLDDNPDVINDFSQFMLGVTKSNEMKAPVHERKEEKEEKEEKDIEKN